MTQKLILVALCCVLNTFVYCTDSANGNGAVKFEVGGKHDESNIKNLFTTMNKKSPDDSESGDGSGDDTEIYSGSGSGQPDKGDEVIEVKTQTPTGKPTKTESKSTVLVINEGDSNTIDPKGTKIPTKKTTTLGNEVEIYNSGTEDPANTVGASVSDEDDDEKPGVNFTVGIIVGVVVGAILAILVIVFLVYRLRKKDEGSYSLDEQSSQAFIRDEKSGGGGGQGKEYFA